MGIVLSVLLFNLLVLITHTGKIADSAICSSKHGCSNANRNVKMFQINIFVL